MGMPARDHVPGSLVLTDSPGSDAKQGFMGVSVVQDSVPFYTMSYHSHSIAFTDWKFLEGKDFASSVQVVFTRRCLIKSCLRPDIG